MELFQQKINEKYPKESLQVLVYKNTKQPCKIKCKTCGKVYNYKMGSTALAKQKKSICQDCGRRRKIKKRFEQSLHDKYPNEPFELIDFITTQHPATLKCLKCGKVTRYQVIGSIRNKKHLCNSCYPQRREDLEKTKQKFETYIKNSADWILLSDLNDITSSQDLVLCKCVTCGKINHKTIYDYCDKKIQCACKRKKDNVNKIIKKICDEEGYQCLSLDKKNTYRDRICLRHECGYIYQTKAQSFISGYGRCPKCITKMSQENY